MEETVLCGAQSDELVAIAKALKIKSAELLSDDDR